MSDQFVKIQPVQIILTGAIGVGKSTLANRLLSSITKKALGFKTVPLFANQIKVGYGFQPLGGEVISFAQYDPLTKLYQVDLGVFEKLGCAILRAAWQTNQFLFIDEIGFFEKPAKDFCQLIKNVLRSHCDYLVVIQQRVLDFWLEGLPREVLTLVEVTPENRDRFLIDLTPRLKAIEPA